MQQAIADLIREKAAAGDVLLRFRLVSSSMSPLLEVGDWVSVVPAAFDTVQPGDLVLYENQGRFCCHRLLQKSSRNGSRQLWTKGDHVLTSDSPWDASRLLGKVTAVQRGQQHIDVNRRKWRILNSTMALLSRGQRAAWTAGVSLKRILMGSRKTHLSPLLIRVLRVPGKLVAKMAGFDG